MYTLLELRRSHSFCTMRNPCIYKKIIPEAKRPRMALRKICKSIRSNMGKRLGIKYPITPFLLYSRMLIQHSDYILVVIFSLTISSVMRVSNRGIISKCTEVSQTTPARYVSIDNETIYGGGGSSTGIQTREVMVTRYKPWALLIIMILCHILLLVVSDHSVTPQPPPTQPPVPMNIYILSPTEWIEYNTMDL